MFGGANFLFAVKYSMQCLIKIFILNHCVDQGCKIETLEQSYRRILCSTPLHFIHRSYRDTALHFLGSKMSHDKPDSCPCLGASTLCHLLFCTPDDRAIEHNRSLVSLFKIQKLANVFIELRAECCRCPTDVLLCPA